jgi:hypothetical protein
MAMELLAFDNKFVAYLAADDQDDNLISFDIIQRTQVPCPKLILRQSIWSQALDRFRGRGGLVLQPSLNRRFQDSLLACWQGPELPVGVFGDGDLERHGTNSVVGLFRRMTLLAVLDFAQKLGECVLHFRNILDLGEFPAFSPDAEKILHHDYGEERRVDCNSDAMPLLDAIRGNCHPVSFVAIRMCAE